LDYQCDSFLLVSIHAPARGATIVNYDRFQILQVSIHAPARGATVTGYAERN